MKMVKSLLLGSAAGIIAVAGAQAADLPVKAKPVEYVKICSLYGAGYYYMPGTDICLKLGGFVRYQANWNAGNNLSGGPQLGAPGGFNTRASEQDFTQRVRAVITVDTRQQTAYGTLRTYLLLGYNQDTTALGTTSPPVYMNRGFIQIAGFTFGKATSFFDIFPNASFAYNAGNNFSGDSGDGGVILMSYTAQFGNGFSGTLGIEHQRRGTPTVYTIGAVGAPLNPYILGALPAGTNNLGGVSGNYPDLVGNLRFDQSWGTWIVAGALHDVSASYFGLSSANANEAFGHPSQQDRLGGHHRLHLEPAVYHPRRPVLGAGGVFAGRDAVPCCDPHRRQPDVLHRQPVRVRLLGGRGLLWQRVPQQLRADHGVEHQRCVRASVDAVVEDLLVWVVHRRQPQRGGGDRHLQWQQASPRLRSGWRACSRAATRIGPPGRPARGRSGSRSRVSPSAWT